MIGSKITLAAATATKIASAGTGSNTVKFRTALTDLALGGPTVTVATGYAPGAAVAAPGIDIYVGGDDLYAISTAGGDVYVLYPENP